MKKNVFVSFDYDYDVEIKDALIGQSKLSDSPFSIRDMSIKEEINENWKKKARERIRKCDCVIFLCGRHTNQASGVSAEMSITVEEDIPYFLLCGRKEGNVYKPKNAKSSDKVYKWTWENLKALLNGAR